MPNQPVSFVENNFTKGLITESTGLNFPENAATSTDNCIFTLVGDVTRRAGINFETNFTQNSVNPSGGALSTFKWENVGGDGSTQIVVTQVGGVLFFYLSSAATTSGPLSTRLLGSTVNLSNFKAAGLTAFDPTLECQYANGNGNLFVFNPGIDPVYCTYNNGSINAASINIQVRDFIGLPETGTSQTSRPLQLTDYHQYNLINQGWSSAPKWNFFSTTPVGLAIGATAQFLDAPLALPVALGDSVTVQGGINWQSSGGVVHSSVVFNGTMTGYSGTIMNVVINSFTISPALAGPIVEYGWYVQQGASVSYIQTWHTQVGSYPSSSDVWWNFKDSTNVFNPSATIGNVTLASPAPKGAVILAAFNQQPASITGVPATGITSTTVRPRTGCWFQGRVWYAGVDASSYSNGITSQYYTWTENIYFSQIIQETAQFGKCYQQNDPTSETLFDLLPTDGGVIQIPGTGAIYKLFPIQNGLLVFAANGIWFITGSTGIGFSANDYTIVKMSEIRSISGMSFVNVNGLPYFWNEEGIYTVAPSQGGTLTVNPITVGTILSFYLSIPQSSRVFARGSYDPLNYQIQWLYKSTSEADISSRYQFDSILNFNTYNKAFFPYSIKGTTPKISGILYVSSPGGISSSDPVFKYLTQFSNGITFSEENDDVNYKDFVSYDSVGTDYTSFFITGYKLRGQAIRKFQLQYLNIFTRMNGEENGYILEGIWDFANQSNSNRWSSRQVVYNIDTRFDTVSRRHRIRGQGYSLQFKISSVSGLPFDIQGWATIDTVNTGA